MWTDPLAVFSSQRPACAEVLERRQFFFSDKHELDAAVEKALRYGWKLLSRCYSSEKGHGADLARPRVSKAA